MRVKTVSFRSNITIKSFQHVHIELMAEVDEGEDWRVVLEELKSKVAEELVRAKKGERRASGRFVDLIEEDR